MKFLQACAMSAVCVWNDALEGSKGPGPDASRKDSGDSGPVGEAIPVRTDEGPAGNDAPPRSGPLTVLPRKFPESSGSENRR